MGDVDFLRLIGGWREERDSGVAGLTAAGLLMFGQWSSIVEAFPLYFLDYQERSNDPDSQTRWLDRIVPDGSWSGNLYDFFRRVIRKLTADLKVPFVLKGESRIDDTPTHQALREALVNCLIHADYSGRASLLVVKQPSGFSFRNPGVLRVPAAMALQGGASDCRNRTLHQMFLFINLGERAGSGLPKIIAGWKGEGHSISLADSFEPFDQTVLEMNWSESSLAISSATSVGSSPISSPISSLKTEERIIQRLRDDPKCSAQQLGDALGISKRAVLKQIEKLKQQGRLSRIGSAKGGHWEILK